MWAQRDGRPAEYTWCPLFNAAKFGWCPLLEYRAVTLPRCKTRSNLQGCLKLANGSQLLVDLLCRVAITSTTRWSSSSLILLTSGKAFMICFNWSATNHRFVAPWPVYCRLMAAILFCYHAMQLCYRGLGSRNSVRPSVRPSICLSHACFVNF